MSQTTSKYRKLHILFKILSLASMLVPVTVYAIIGYVQGSTTQKVSLSFTVIAAIILFAISILFKYRLRSPVFILLLGIYMALREITVAIIIVSVCTILDEFIFTPLAKKYKSLLTINKEIDKRLNE